MDSTNNNNNTRFKVTKDINDAALINSQNNSPTTSVKEKFEIVRFKKNSLSENSFNQNESNTNLVKIENETELNNSKSHFENKADHMDFKNDNYNNIKVNEQIKFIDDDGSRIDGEQQPKTNTDDSVFQNVSESKSFNSITSGNRVKFSSDTTPLLNEENFSSNRAPKVSQRWLDEKGLIIDKSQLTPKNDAGHKSSKSFKVQYDRDNKSLEFVINLGNKNNKEHGMLTQLKYISFYQALIGEILGTYLLVLFVCGFGLAGKKAGDPEIFGSLTGSIASGLVVSTLVWGFAHVSGANLNPAVSVALLIIGETNLLRVLLYIPCQLLGSTVAVITLKELFAPQNVLIQAASAASNSSVVTKVSLSWLELTQTQLHTKLTQWQGFSIEALITFILVLTIFACIDSERKDLGGSFPLTIGLSITACSLFGGKFTGGSMNPARTFGPAFVLNNWANHWVYWAGPMTGAIIGAISYKLLVFKTTKIIKK